MKRFSPVLLLLVASCSGSATAPDQPTIPAATLRSAPPVVEAYVTCTDFCQGGKAWWNVSFDVGGVEDLDRAVIRVYTVTEDGTRTYFGMAHEGSKGQAVSDLRFYVEAAAPVVAMRDIWGEELPPNYGYMAFHFDVFVVGRFIGTGSNYSDVPLASNLCPGVCVGAEHRSTPQIDTSCQ